MEYVAIVTVLSLLQFTLFGFQVGALRGKHSVKAPAMSGNDEFDRMYRVHYNTMEQLVLILPAMWMFAYSVNPIWAAGFGAVYLVARFIYRAAYLKDPAGRSLGFTLSLLPGVVMLVWVLVVEIKDLL